MAIDTTRTPKKTAGYTLEAIDNQLVLFQPGHTAVCRLNETAALIWKLCDGDRSVADIIYLLSDLYPDETPHIDRDVREGIEVLMGYRAITLEG